MHCSKKMLQCYRLSIHGLCLTVIVFIKPWIRAHERIGHIISPNMVIYRVKKVVWLCITWTRSAIKLLKFSLFSWIGHVTPHILAFIVSIHTCGQTLAKIPCLWASTLWFYTKIYRTCLRTLLISATWANTKFCQIGHVTQFL